MLEAYIQAAEQLRRTISSSASSPSPTFKVTASLATQEEGHDRSTTADQKISPETEESDFHGNEIKTASKTKGSSRDPLRWFGILVPPALRASQEAFTHAVVEVIPTIASVSEELRIVEDEIRSKRRELGKGD